MPPLASKAKKLAKAFSEPRIVLAIDYGTTFTGLAWMQNDGATTPELSHLNLFVNWPEKNDVKRNEAKVPSEVTYSITTDLAGDQEYRQWGFSIENGPFTKVLRWTKLDLVTNTSPLRQLEKLEELIKGLAQMNALYAQSDKTNDVPRHLARTTKDVIEFYLSHVAEEWVRFVIAQAKFVLDEVPVDIVVTHPAMWPDSARSTLVRAVSGAFNKVRLPTRRHIYVKSEPEACTLFVIQNIIKKSPGQLRTGNCFTLCDAGGGTVDLVSYYLASLAPLQLIKVSDVTGDTIGATSVDRAFLKWLGTKVSNLDIHPGEYGKGGQYVLNPRVSLLLRRFEGFKKSFTGKESFELNLTRDAILISPEDDNETRSLHISSDQMKLMFEESVEGVKLLILQQKTQVEEAFMNKIRCKISDIFLAGGFAESPYLYDEVNKTARKHGSIRVQRADDCWSSVVKGAVLAGMGFGAPPPPRIGSCPRRYGFLLISSSEQDEGSWSIDPLDENAILPNPFSSDKLIWLVDEGEVIFADSELQKTVKLRFRCQKRVDSSMIMFVANSSNSMPAQVSELNRPDHARETETAYIAVRLDSILQSDYSSWRASKRKPGIFELLFDLVLTVTSVVTVDIKLKGRVVGTHSMAL